ncbi:13460_t:CDS:2 [Entrophospora sp. SA101]|nr:13460_t:CDS:2 [Entrophospora sp. SA101]
MPSSDKHILDEGIKVETAISDLKVTCDLYCSSCKNHKEENCKGLINKWFRDFAKNISIRSGITIDTFRDIEFSGNPFKNQVVNLERTQYSLDNFDMVLVFKDYSQPPKHINRISMNQLEDIKEWLYSMNILYYEGTPDLSWTQIMRNINQDAIGFYKNGGWSFLDMDEKDDDSETQSDSVSEFEPTENEENYNESSDYEEEEEAVSMKSAGPGEASDESTLNWDKLKEKICKVDKKRQEIKHKNSNDVHGSSSTNTNKKPRQS